MNTMEALREQIRRWRKDPVLFVRKALNGEPTEQQLQILNAIAPPGAKVTVRSGHGVGKTAVAAWISIWHVLLFEDSKTPVTAPAAPQLKDVLFPEISKWLNNAHPWIREQLEVKGTLLVLRSDPKGQFLTARTARADKPDALQGFHATHLLFVVEEAFGVADPIYEVARGALSTPNARALLIGNPTATSGYAYNTHHINKDKPWKSFVLSCINSPLASKEYIQEMKDEFGEDSDIYKVRVLGEFPSTSVNQLISRQLADAALGRQANRESYHYAPVVLGVDVAWEGNDRSAVYLRQGLVAKKLGSWYKLDNMTLGGLVDQWWTEYKADAVFIDVGWGTGVIDYLRSIGRSPIPVNFGGASLSAEYKDKRTEMWLEMRKWLESGGCISEAELVEDLVGPQYYFLPSGKKVLERKKDMKKRGLKSPDLADALALCFAAPVRKLSEVEKMNPRGTGVKLARTEYNLFDD